MAHADAVQATPYKQLFDLRVSSAVDREIVYRDHARTRLQLTAFAMGVTAVVGSGAGTAADPTPELVTLRCSYGGPCT